MTFVFSRRLFLRLLGVVYLVAFASLGVQITGLVGAHGILPIGELLARARTSAGVEAFHALPTLLWLSSGDAMLLFLCWGGAALSLLLIAGVIPVVTSALVWMFYLSLLVGAADGLARAGRALRDFPAGALPQDTAHRLPADDPPAGRHRDDRQLRLLQPSHDRSLRRAARRPDARATASHASRHRSVPARTTAVANGDQHRGRRDCLPERRRFCPRDPAD